jgi:hypothetical protein
MSKSHISKIDRERLKKQARQQRREAKLAKKEARNAARFERRPA